MKQVLWFLNHLDDLLGGAMLVLVVAVTSVGVFYRFVLQDPIPWTIELATVAFVWLTFIGASSAMRDNLHIGIDAAVRPLPWWMQEAIGIVVNLLMLWLLWFFITAGWTFAWSAWLKITPVMHWPYTWVDLAVPVGAAMMAVRLIIGTVSRARRLWRGIAPGKEEPHEACTV